jgi:hypothetical protein
LWSRWGLPGREFIRIPALSQFSWIYVTIFLVLLLSLTGWGVANATGYSLPGDALYPVKLRVEGIRLLVSSAPIESTRLQIDLTQERFREVVSLAEEQRTADFPDAVQRYSTQLTTTMTSLADEQSLAEDDRADLTRRLLDDLMDNEQRLTAFFSSLPGDVPLPDEIRAGIQAALALIQGSYERAWDWSGLPPILPPLPSAAPPAVATIRPSQTTAPSPTSTPVPPRASRTPSPESESSEPNDMFAEWPAEWGPLDETPIPEPQWTEVNMPWPTEVPLPTAWPTEIPPLPTIIMEYWPTELPPPPSVTELPDLGTPPAWPPDPDEPPEWTPEE